MGCFFYNKNTLCNTHTHTKKKHNYWSKEAYHTSSSWFIIVCQHYLLCAVPYLVMWSVWVFFSSSPLLTMDWNAVLISLWFSCKVLGSVLSDLADQQRIFLTVFVQCTRLSRGCTWRDMTVELVVISISSMCELTQWCGRGFTFFTTSYLICKERTNSRFRVWRGVARSRLRNRVAAR